ncbi:MAG: acyl carrier protein [Alphaproteobacteria bacterium]
MEKIVTELIENFRNQTTEDARKNALLKLFVVLAEKSVTYLDDYEIEVLQKATFETTLNDELAMDSLDRVELVQEFEQNLSIHCFDDDPIFIVNTVGEFLDRIYSIYIEK